MRLRVLAEVDGKQHEIGVIETLPGSSERFEYAESWLARPNSKSLSLSLPLTEQTFDARHIRPYFEGLLPEEDARKNMAAALGISRYSYLKLLQKLGNECIGAVMIIPEEEIPTIRPHYVALSDDELQEILTKGYPETSKLMARARLSIAGAQAKVGLYKSTENDSWYLPYGTAPATHIIKPANPNFKDLAINEHLCLSVAKRCGIEAPNSFIIDGRQPALAIQRYDRHFFGDETFADGLAMPSRLHQEDFCQALGILGADKYEDGSHRYLADIVMTIRDWSSNPVRDLGKLWDVLVFDYLIGNCDNHIKNLSLIRSRDWTTMRLAPCYDLVNTTMYDDLHRIMGITIGTTRNIDEITRDDFELLAESMGLSKNAMLKRLDAMIEMFPEALTFESDALAADGFAQAKAIGKRILADSKRRMKNISRP